MKNLLLLMIVFINCLNAEFIMPPKKSIDLTLTNNIEFSTNNDYIKIPKSKDIDFSKYNTSLRAAEDAKIKQATEDAKVKQEADEVKIDEIPLAKTFPLEEGQNLDAAILGDI